MKSVQQINNDPINLFYSAMINAGLPCELEFIPDGFIHRFKVEGDKNGSRNGWYVLFCDIVPAGAFGNWKTGQSETWSMKPKEHLTGREQQTWRHSMKDAKKKRAQEQQKIHLEARKKAKRIWQSATVNPAHHPYVNEKQIIPHGIKQRGKTLVIPLRDSDGTLQSLQFIEPNANKRFLSGGKVTGCYWPIGKIKEKLYICEGFATGATIHEATDEAVAVAFNAGNLQRVAEKLRGKFPDLEITICADNDQWIEANPGITKASEAAQVISALLVIPKFKDTTTQPTDFNDLYLNEGIDVVKNQLESAATVQVALSSISEKSEMTL